MRITGIFVARACFCATALFLGFNLSSLALAQSATTVPFQSVFVPPPANTCQSAYDQFYEAEPGVYAYWALCEPGAPAQMYDYVGRYDLTSANRAFGNGTIVGGSPGPVNDGESAAQASTASISTEAQGIPLNSNAGTISQWVNTDALGFPVTGLFMSAVSGKSGVSISAYTGTNGLCFSGNFVNTNGTVFIASNCGYVANTWHRVSLVWTGGVSTLYVDGVSSATATYSGGLDNKVFYFRLFPGCCDTKKQMTLAKVLVSNQAWNSAQVQADASPTLYPVPTGGVYVSSQKLGTIHKDVLGYGDFNENISTPALTSSLVKGLTADGFTSVRHAAGYPGIYADLGNWQGGVMCSKTLGNTGPGLNAKTGDTLDAFMHSLGQRLNLDVVYTVNYGTNPPSCNAGGDPIQNGANLVKYANVTNKYGIKRWEIGNELFSPTTETDFHANPNTGASYAANEPAFYTAMKAQDPTIQVAVPVSLFSYGSQSGFDLPVLGGAKYDAVVWHSYPVIDPVTDGNTLYGDRVSSNLWRTRANLLTLQTELLSNGHSPDAIWITEWNAELTGNKWSKQTMGAVAPLFATSQLGEFMQAGVQMANWWALGGTSVCSTLNYDGQGESAYSWWECGSSSPVYPGPMIGVGEVNVGMQAGQPTPVGRAFQVLSQSGFVTEGESMLQTATDLINAPWLQSYAATHGSSYAVILINRDRDNAHTVPVKLAGKTAGHVVWQWSYGRSQYDASRTGDWSQAPAFAKLKSWNTTFPATLQPWSVNVFIFGE